MKRPYTPAERATRRMIQSGDGTLDGRARWAQPTTSAGSLSQVLGATPAGGGGVGTSASAGRLIEGGLFDDLTLAVQWRFGIDSDLLPYFDGDGAVPLAEAARLTLTAAGHPQLESQP